MEPHADVVFSVLAGEAQGREELGERCNGFGDEIDDGFSLFFHFHGVFEAEDVWMAYYS